MTSKKILAALGVAAFAASVTRGDPLTCDLSAYTSFPGLTATPSEESLDVRWQGEEDNELRMSLAIDAGTPVIRELMVRRKSGPWVSLGRDLRPEFHVTSGVRRRRAGGPQVGKRHARPGHECKCNSRATLSAPRCAPKGALVSWDPKG